MKKTLLTLTAAVETKTYDDLVKFLMNRDMFGHGYSGYWARGVEFDRELGWLVWEQADATARHGQEPAREEAIKAWRSHDNLPSGWHRLDEVMAKEAVVCGIARWGIIGFVENADATRYDVALQLALLDEIRYG